MHGHEHDPGGIDQEIGPPFAPASVHQDRSDQGQQEQGRTEAERPGYQKCHAANRLNRPNDASV
jgi:hypothetical protein